MAAAAEVAGRKPLRRWRAGSAGVCSPCGWASGLAVEEAVLAAAGPKTGPAVAVSATKLPLLRCLSPSLPQPRDSWLGLGTDARWSPSVSRRACSSARAAPAGARSLGPGCHSARRAGRARLARRASGASAEGPPPVAPSVFRAQRRAERLRRLVRSLSQFSEGALSPPQPSAPPPGVPEPGEREEERAVEEEGNEASNEEACAIEFRGELQLASEELETIQQLEELSFHRRAALEGLSAYGGTKLFLLTPLREYGEPTMPSVLKIGSAAHLASELAASPPAAAPPRPGAGPFGRIMTRCVDSALGLCGSSGEQCAVMQLEATGGVCSLPRFASTASRRLRSFRSLLEKTLEGCEEASSSAAEALTLRSAVFSTVQALFDGTIQHNTTGSLRRSSVASASRQMSAAAELQELDLAQCLGVAGLMESLGPDWASASSASYLGLDASAADELVGGQRGVRDLFAWLSSSSSAPQRCFSCRPVELHGDIHVDNVLQDGEGRAWVLDAASLQQGHVFFDLAAFFGSTLVAYADLQFSRLPDSVLEQEEETIRGLLRLLASIPSLELPLPEPPEEASGPARLVWELVLRMLVLFREGYSQRPGQAEDRRELQLAWALLAGCLRAARDEREGGCTRARQLAFYGSVAFAARLRAASGDGEEPPWLVRDWHRWEPTAREPEVDMQQGAQLMSSPSHFLASSTPKLSGRKGLFHRAATCEVLRQEDRTSRQPLHPQAPAKGAPADPLVPATPRERRPSQSLYTTIRCDSRKGSPSAVLYPRTISRGAYLGMLGEREAWAADPLTKVKHSVLDEVCEAVPQVDGQQLDPVGYEDVYALWRLRGRALVLSTEATEIALLGRQLVVHAAEEELARGEETPRLPVRLSLAGLENSVPEGLARECKAIGPLRTQYFDEQEDVIMQKDEEWVRTRLTLVAGPDDEEDYDRRSLREGMVEMQQRLQEFHERREREWQLRQKLHQLFEDHAQQVLAPEDFGVLKYNAPTGWWLLLHGTEEASVHVDVLLRLFEFIMKRHPQHNLLIMARSGPMSSLLSEEWCGRWGIASFRTRPLDEQRLQDLCGRHLQHVCKDERNAVLAELVDPSYRPLVSSPGLASMALQSLHIARKAQRLGTGEGGYLSRYEVYEVAAQALLLRVASRRRHIGAGTSGSKAEDAQVLIEARLALERAMCALQRAGRCELRRADLVTGSVGRTREFLLALWECAQTGRAPLLEALSEDAVSVFHRSMQEFLAAQHLWRRLAAGERLPSWLAREGEAGADAASGAGCLLGAVALARSQRARVERTGPPQPLPAASHWEFTRTLGAMLRNAARAGDAEAIRGLHELAADWGAVMCDRVGPSGWLPVHLAAERGHDAALAALAELGAPLSAGDAAGRTPAHLAARFGHVGTLRVLRDLGAPLDAQAGGGWTPAHTAAARGRLEVLEALDSLGAALGVRSDRGWNAADVATLGEIRRMLKARGVHATHSL